MSEIRNVRGVCVCVCVCARARVCVGVAFVSVRGMRASHEPTYHPTPTNIRVHFRTRRVRSLDFNFLHLLHSASTGGAP